MREEIIEKAFESNNNFVHGLSSNKAIQETIDWVLELSCVKDNTEMKEEAKETILEIFQCSPVFEDWMTQKECQQLSRKLEALRQKCLRIGLSDVLEKRITYIFEYYF